MLTSLSLEHLCWGFFKGSPTTLGGDLLASRKVKNGQVLPRTGECLAQGEMPAAASAHEKCWWPSNGGGHPWATSLPPLAVPGSRLVCKHGESACGQVLPEFSLGALGVTVFLAQGHSGQGP